MGKQLYRFSKKTSIKKSLFLLHRYVYSIIEGNEEGIFRVDPTDGRVFIPLTGSPGVNFTRSRVHNLTVQAQNSMADCQRARIRININVISNRITFDPLEQQSVPEMTPEGTVVVRVTVRGGAGEVRYSITSGNVGNAFRINQNSGTVMVNGELDFETLSSYTLAVRVDSVGTTVNGTINLQISVTDVNEQHVFTSPSCALTPGGCPYSISENRGPTMLADFDLMDPDRPPNGTLSFALSGVNSNAFSVDSSGVLRTAQSLDREAQDTYLLTLTVTDQCPRSSCRLTAETTIQVTVTDENDNAPTFTLALNRVEVSEDANRNLIVAEYRATDADIGANAVITYSIELISGGGSLPFSIHPQLGSLRLTGNIDFEMTESYMVRVTASNPGSSQATSAETLIQILNVNDNTPMFLGAPYSGNVEENSPTGTSVLRVNATDADVGIHGDIRYSIIAGSTFDSFQIGSTNGSIWVNRNIDRETITSFNLTVRARDRGTPQQLSATTVVTITVTDVNDNRPVFQPDSFDVLLREDLEIGNNVVQPLATDADQPNTPNSEIVYSILASGNEEGRFRINSSSGQIETAALLDFETTTRYTLTVRADDRGNPVMFGTATVSILIGNVNENPPSLNGSQIVNVSEAAPVTTIIAIFRAEDRDQMVITYAIMAGNEDQKFSINASSGVIRLVVSLDFETRVMYILNISASDGQRESQATLTVKVLDENEHTPVFNGPNAFAIEEERPAGAMVGRVMATDADRDAQVSFSFVQQDRATGLFNLDPANGQITTAVVLDREQLEQIFPPTGSSSVSLQVSARDDGSPSRRDVRSYTITLLDINDNTPLFRDSSYSNSLRENLPAGEEVFQIAATDADIGRNGEIVYSFELADNQGTSNPFTIDSTTGALTTSESLDCEIQPFYTFSIVATDGGVAPLFNTTIGNLSIIDENDNSPIFTQDVYVVNVSESTMPQSVVTTVLANDRDKGLNGEVEYRIESDSDINDFLEVTEIVTRFTIDSVSGMVTNRNEFDFESATQINVTVFANDRGIPQRTASALIVVNVINEDESGPRFTSCPTAATVPESILVGTVVLTCEATDRDSIAVGNQPPVAYSFVFNTNFFEIDNVTGQIRTTATLDREELASHFLRVRVTDLSGRSAQRDIRVRLLDINDEAPQFQNAPYEFFFTSSAMTNVQQFLTVSAIDRDNEQNGTFEYSIGNVVQSSDGQISFTSVEVVARDFGTPTPLSSSAIVSVTFAQLCQLQRYSISRSTGELSATLLCSVTATPSSVITLVLGERSELSCAITTNTPVSYQKLHNGTSVTTPQVISSGRAAEEDVRFGIEAVRFSDLGEYACLVTSVAGSLQTPAVTTTLLGGLMCVCVRVRVHVCVYVCVFVRDKFQLKDILLKSCPFSSS